MEVVKEAYSPVFLANYDIQIYDSRQSLYLVCGLIKIWSIMFQKIALFVGIILIVIAAVLLIGTSDPNTSVVLGLLGIFVIGVFFLSKKKKWLVSNK